MKNPTTLHVDNLRTIFGDKGWIELGKHIFTILKKDFNVDELGDIDEQLKENSKETLLKPIGK
jgi:hypothetical protein